METTTAAAAALTWLQTRPAPHSLPTPDAVYAELRCLDAWERDHAPLAYQDLSSPRFSDAWGSDAWTRLEESLERDKEVVRVLDPVREGLRQRAMELWNGKLRGLRVTDLPVEVLRAVFGVFGEVEVGHLGRRVNWRWYPMKRGRKGEERPAAVRSARLVCRLFWELATPLMFEVLRVSVSRGSLELMDAISRNPVMAAGVRGVLVVLDYRPAEVAADLDKYKKVRLKAVSHALDRVEYYYEIYEFGTEMDEDGEKLKQALDKGSRIEWSWTHALAREEGKEGEYGFKKPGGDPGLRQMLLDGYAEFCRLHEEQLRLLEDGTFVSGVVDAIARMGHVASLSVIDSVEPTFLELEEEMQLLTNREMLARFMPSPLAWDAIEEIDGGADLVPARVLSELPIAIHRSGAPPLREYQVACFPITNNYSMIRPSLPSFSWTDLATACRGLTSFHFGDGNMNNLPIRYDHISGSNANDIDSFFGAVLAGSCSTLKELDLNFRPLGINDGGAEEKLGWYRASTFLSAVQELPRLRRLSLCEVEVEQSVLEALCGGMGDGMVDDLRLYRVILRPDKGSDAETSWAGILDLLREKYRRPKSDGSEISLEHLYGGEIGYKWGMRIGWQGLKPSVDFGDPPLCMKKAEDYIFGETDRNPFRDE